MAASSRRSTTPAVSSSRSTASRSRPNPLYIARGVFALACVLQIGFMLVQHFYPALLLPRSTPAASRLSLFSRLLQPGAIQTIVWWIVLAGLCVLLAELVYAIVRLILWGKVVQRTSGTYHRIRTPNPQSSTKRIGDNPPDGADLWHTLHRLFPEHRSANDLGPWLTMTISARPDEPAEFGAVIASETSEAQAQWSAAFRQIVIGHNPEAVIDTPPDPLQQAIEGANGAQGHVLAWAEFLLPLPPSYPLRIPDDAEADLIGPLVAQIRPRVGAVRYAEAQISVQPRHDWRMDGSGWRSVANRRYERLRQRSFGLLPSSDAKALERKLDGPAYNAVLRIVVIGENRAAAERMLREVGAVLGQYAARSGHLLQRFVVAHKGCIAIPREQAAPRKVLLFIAALISALVPALASTWLPFGVWSFFPIPALVAQIMPLLLPLLLLVAPPLAARRHYEEQTGAMAHRWIRRLAARAPRFVPPRNLLLPFAAWWRPAILSSSELGGVFHLPAPDQGNLVRWLPCRYLPAPAHAFIPQRQGPPIVGDMKKRITLGHAVRSDGQLAPVGPTLFDLRQILHFTAGMGAGKSRLFANIFLQIIADGLFLIDGKGDDAGNLIDTVLGLLSLEDEARIVLLDITDAEWPIGLNPLAGVAINTPGAIDLMVAQIQSIFARIDPETWGSAPGMQQFLEMGARLVVEVVPFPTLAHVKQALIDEEYRNTLLQSCTKLEVLTFWQVIYPTSSDQQKTSMNALMRRFDKLLLSDVIRSLVTQEIPTFSFSEAIEEKLIVLAPIPHVTYGHLAATAAMLMFQLFVRAAFERPGSALTRPNYPLIVDEFGVLVNKGATEDVESALTQLRSLGVPTLYANQTMDQIGELSDKILINAENRIIMRTQQPDAGMYAKHYEAAGFSGADVSNQEPTEHQYARFVVDGKTAGPLSMVPLPWPAPVAVLVEAYSGPDWQTITPATLPRRPGDDRTLADAMADRISSDYDAALCHLIYQEPYSEQRAMDLAKMPDEEWNLMRSRWAAIAVAQRQYIDDNPGCIPDRKERIRWRSRLRSRRPRLLATIEFLRIRRATGLDELVKQVQEKKDKKDQRKDGRPGAANGAGANGSFGGRDEGQQHWRNTTEPAKPPFEGPADQPHAAPMSEG